jgi:hypothetical protein
LSERSAGRIVLTNPPKPTTPTQRDFRKRRIFAEKTQNMRAKFLGVFGFFKIGFFFEGKMERNQSKSGRKCSVLDSFCILSTAGGPHRYCTLDSLKGIDSFKGLSINIYF